MLRNKPIYVAIPTDSDKRILYRLMQEYSQFVELRGLEGEGEFRVARCATCVRYLGYVRIFLSENGLAFSHKREVDTGPIRPKAGGLDAI